MAFVDFDEMTDGCVNARRNYFMGVWAGKQLGLRSDQLDDYAASVMEADSRVPGPADVIAKVKTDLARFGKALTDTHLLEQFKSFERQARAEMLVTD